MEKKRSFAQAISDILVKENVISRSEADSLQSSFVDSNKESFDDFLLSEGLVQKSDLLNALSIYYQVPAFDIAGYFFEEQLLKKFPKFFLINSAFLPIQVDGEVMSIVVSEPNSPELLSDIGRYLSYDIVMSVGLKQDILDAIEEYYLGPYDENIELT